MKRLISLLLLTAIGATLTACSRTENADVQTTSAFVSYDYGRINTGKITTLFNGCFIDFEYKSPERRLIPGDVVNFKHTGYMLSTMSYPGNTQLSGGKLLDVSYSYAAIREVDDTAIHRDDSGLITLVDNADGVKHVIINQDFDFVPLCEYAGQKLYASYSCSNNSDSDIAALFAFNPRI